MNKFTLPPCPNWYESNIMACAPDNTLIYGNRSDLVILNPKSLNEPADVQIVFGVHKQRITCVNVNPNWSEGEKLVVSAGDDKKVHVWDAANLKLKYTNEGHTTCSDRLIAATFCGNARVVSVSELGFVIIWKMATHELSSLKILSGLVKFKVTSMSVCPHTSWLASFGFKNGLIVVADLRKTGHILYRFRRHTTSIISLSWCPAPVNVFPKIEIKVLKTKSNVKRVAKDVPNGASQKSVLLDAPLEGISESLITDCASQEHALPDTSEVISESLITEDVSSSLNPNCEEFQPLAQVPVGEEYKVDAPAPVIDHINYDELLCYNVDAAIDHQVAAFFKNFMEQPPESVEISTQINAEGNDPKGTVDEDDTSTSLPKGDCVEPVHESDSSAAVHDGDPSADVCKGDPSATVHESDPSTTADVILTNGTSEPVVFNKEYLLASSAVGDNKIIIWRAGTDGAVQTELHLPSSNTSRKNANYKDYKVWIALCWATPTCLLSSNSKAELIQWNFENASKDQKFKNHVVHGDHQFILFNIVTPLKIYDSSAVNWRDEVNVWTTGRDRLLLNSSLFPRCENCVSYETLAGHITCLSSCPISPTRIAMGLSDGGCRVMDLSRPHLQRLITQSFDKMNLKVSSLAWHPLKENILACGSVDGQVVTLNTYQGAKGVTRFVQHCHAPITQVDWGPRGGDLENFGLYVVINGKLILYDTDNSLIGPEIVSCVDSDVHVSQLAWKPDFSMFAIGTKIGHVLVFSKEMNSLFSFYFHNKLIRCISWHYEATEEDATVSLYSNWLAVCSNEIFVYDCSITDANAFDQDISQRIVCTLNDDMRNITCGAWSPHENGKFATVTDSGKALVWDIKTKTIISTCLSINATPFYSVLWSPLDPDYIITTNKDIKMQIWKISENPPKVTGKPSKPKIVPAQVLVPKKEAVVEEEQVQSEEAINKATETSKRQVRNKLVLAGLAACQDSMHAPLVEDLNRLYKFFYENKTDTIEQEGINIMKLFGTKEDIVSLLQLEQFSGVKRRSNNASHHMSLWQGNIGESMKQAISTKSLTWWHVAIAPSISHQSWREVCVAYASQLSEDTNANPFEIASYYLAAHKIEEAIETLCVYSKYREALALAKCRLPLNSSRIDQVIEKWAEFSSRAGNYEIAAQCYIVLKRLDDAILSLFRRTDLTCDALELCVKMAKRSNNKSLLDSAQFKLKELLKAEEGEVTLRPLLNRIDVELQNLEEEIEIIDNESILSFVDESEENNVELALETNYKTEGEERAPSVTVLSDSGVLSDLENLCLGDGQFTIPAVDNAESL